MNRSQFGLAHTRPQMSLISQMPQVLVKGLQAGIIPPPSRSLGELVHGLPSIPYNESFKDDQDLDTLHHHSLIMPEMWVKGTRHSKQGSFCDILL